MDFNRIVFVILLNLFYATIFNDYVEFAVTGIQDSQMTMPLATASGNSLLKFH